MSDRITRSYEDGLRARQRVSELMNRPDYAHNELAQIEVREIFRRAYGTAPINAPTNPGQAAADPFSRHG